MNLARRPKSLAFSIVPDGEHSRIEWAGEVDMSADDLVSKQASVTNASKVDLAKQIIGDLLADGARGSSEVLQACIDAGVSERTYHTARKALRVVSKKTGFNDGQWLLSLPFEAATFEDF